MNHIVRVDHDTMFEEHLCRESPWGTVYEVSKELCNWLDNRLGPDAWDYGDWAEATASGMAYGGTVFIEDKRTAILFSLKFGMDSRS